MHTIRRERLYLSLLPSDWPYRAELENKVPLKARPSLHRQNTCLRDSLIESLGFFASSDFTSCVNTNYTIECESLLLLVN